jgi:hypothetical protein
MLSVVRNPAPSISSSLHSYHFSDDNKIAIIDMIFNFWWLFSFIQIHHCPKLVIEFSLHIEKVLLLERGGMEEEKK